MAELRELRYLVAVVEEGQMVAAARRLHVAQPALSQAIAKLERDLGVILLERHPRGVRPTAAGAEIVEKARQALAAADGVRTTAHHWAQAGTEQIVLGALPMSLPIVGALLDEARRLHPALQLTLHQLDFTTIRSELRAGRVDVELASPAPPTDEFAVTVLATVGRVAHVPAGHRLAQATELTVEQLRGEAMWGRHPGVPEDWMDDVWLTERLGERPPVTAAQPRTPEEVWLLVASGQAIAVAPGFVAVDLALPGLVSIPVIDAPPARVALLCRRDDGRRAIQMVLAAARATATRLSTIG